MINANVKLNLTFIYLNENTLNEKGVKIAEQEEARKLEWKL